MCLKLISKSKSLLALLWGVLIMMFATFGLPKILEIFFK